MIEKFLKSKHWQLFILTFGIQILAQITMMIFLFSSMHNNDLESDPSQFFRILKYFPLVMILYIFVYLGWIYSVSVGLQSKVPQGIIMKLKKFKILFYAPIIYYAIFIFGFSLLLSTISNDNSENNFALFDTILPFLVPVHLFMVFCMLYCLYFAAKTIKTVELQREVKFGDFIGEFFLIWFYFIGVWILQPKINKMVETGNDKHFSPKQY